MVDIFDEVSGDLRAERAALLLRRYGVFVVAAAILVLLAVAAGQIYNWHQTQRNNQAASRFLQLSQELDNAGPGLANAQRTTLAAQLTSFAATAPSGYRSLARLRAAGLYADAGNGAAAEDVWNSIAGDPQADPMLRDLANLLWAQHALGTAPDAAVAARLTPLTIPENPFHALAEETEALMYLRQGNTAQAKALFSQIAGDPGATEGVRNRADGLLAKLNG